MVPGPLQVERHKIHARSKWWLLCEEALGDLLGKELVVGLGGFLSQTSDKAIHTSSTHIVDLPWTMESLKSIHSNTCVISRENTAVSYVR